MLAYNEKSSAAYLEAAINVSSYGGLNTSIITLRPQRENAPPKVDYWLGKAYHLNND